jgi:hypothetical protein
MGCVHSKDGKKPSHNRTAEGSQELPSLSSLDLDNYVEESELNKEKLRKVSLEEMRGFHRLIGALTF